MTLRATKGSRLTHAELDGNFIELDKRIFRATTAPTASNDSTQDFMVGDEWKNTTDFKTYECKNNAEGSAVWELKKSGLFESNASLIYPNINEHNKSWIVGSDEMDYNSSKSNEKRVFFDYAKGAFRAGYCDEDTWNTSKLGDNSFACGEDTEANYDNTFACGYSTTAEASQAFASGYRTRAKGYGSATFGSYVEADNDYEIAYGDTWYKSSSSLLSWFMETYDANPESLGYALHTADGSRGVEFFEYTLVANKDDDAEKWVRKGEFLVTRTATTCTISHHTGTDIIKDVVGWDMQIVTDGADFSFDVTGEASKTICWVINLKKTKSHRSA